MSKELWRAIGEKRQSDAMKLIKETKLEIGSTYAHAWTCLQAACERGYVDVVQKLIELGSPINSVDWSGDTPLHSAAFHGHPGVTQVLLDKKVKHIANKTGRFACHEAATKGHVEVLKLLLGAYPASCNVQDSAGNTPLHDAAAHGHTEAVKLLIRCRSDPSIRNYESKHTALDLAKKYNHPTVAKYLANVKVKT